MKHSERLLENLRRLRALRLETGHAFVPAQTLLPETLYISGAMAEFAGRLEQAPLEIAAAYPGSDRHVGFQALASRAICAATELRQAAEPLTQAADEAFSHCRLLTLEVYVKPGGEAELLEDLALLVGGRLAAEREP